MKQETPVLITFGCGIIAMIDILIIAWLLGVVLFDLPHP